MVHLQLQYISQLNIINFNEKDGDFLTSKNKNRYVKIFLRYTIMFHTQITAPGWMYIACE